MCHLPKWKKLASYHGCVENMYDYGEDVICVVKNKSMGKIMWT